MFSEGWRETATPAAVLRVHLPRGFPTHIEQKGCIVQFALLFIAFDSRRGKVEGFEPFFVSNTHCIGGLYRGGFATSFVTLDHFRIHILFYSFLGGGGTYGEKMGGHGVRLRVSAL